MSAEGVRFLAHRGTAAELLADLLAVVDDSPIAPGRREALRATLKAARRPTVRWGRLGPGLHEIDGVRHRPELAGFEAAHCAISSPGHGVRAADFCAPDTAHPDVAVRAAIKRAAQYLDAYSPALAAEVRSLRIVRGAVVYRPTGRCDVVT